MKKITSTLVIIAMIAVLLPATMLSVTVLANRSAYNYSQMTSYDEIISASPQYVIRGANGRIGALGAGESLVFRNVDFGDRPAELVHITTGLPAYFWPAGLEFRIGSRQGPIIASVIAIPSDWYDQMVTTSTLEFPVTGVHDLYVVQIGGPIGLFGWQFSTSSIDTSGFLLYDPAPMFVDIEGEFRREIEVVVGLGLIEPYDRNRYRPNFPVGRDEFARTVAMLLTNEPPTSTNVPPFSDVPVSHPYAGVIAYLQSMGVVSGHVSGTFAPMDFIRTIDAATMVLRAMGWGPVAQERGGYPEGYRLVARQEGLLQGLNDEGFLNRGTLARLMYNAVNIEFPTTAIVWGSGTQFISRERGILNRNRGIRMGEAVVAATGSTQLFSPISNLPYYQVMIGDEIYNVGETIAASLLGVLVEFYYRYDNGQRTLLAIVPARRVTTQIIQTGIGTYISRFDANGLEYSDETGRVRRITFPSDIRIIHNGKALDRSLDEIVDAETFRGQIRVVNNGGNFGQTLVIEQYTNIIVEFVDRSALTITNRLGDRQVYDMGATGTLFSIYMDGSSFDIREVEIGAVAMVFESKNLTGDRLIRVIIQNYSVTGTVTEISNEGVVINGRTYRLALENESNIQVGLSATFRLNAFEEIVDYQTADIDDGVRVGVIVQLGITAGAFDTGTIRVRLLTTQSDFQILNLRIPLTLDGIRRTNFNEIVTWLGAVDMMTPVRYRVNADNEIIMLDTHLDGDMGPDDIVVRRSSRTWDFDAANPPATLSVPTFYWRGESRGLIQNYMMSYFVSSDVWVARILRAGEERWTLNRSMATVYGELFSFSRKPNAAIDFVVSYHGFGGGLGGAEFNAARSDHLIVESLGQRLNDEGEIEPTIFGFRGNTRTSIHVSNQTLRGNDTLRNVVENLQFGDFIGIHNEFGSATNIVLRYRPNTFDGTVHSSNPAFDGGPSGYSQVARIILGTVVARIGDYVLIERPDGIEEFIFIRGTETFRVSADGRRTIVTSAGVLRGDVVLANIRYGVVRHLVIYEDVNL